MTASLRRAVPLVLALSSFLGAPGGAAAAKQLTLPPDGDNQLSTVTQGIGLVTVTVDYSSPNVHAPDGSDRKGKIWGGLVAYGMSDLGYNDCKSCPWRGGANENTVFTVSHDVKIEGQPLKAGTYGLHFIPDPAEWTVIFSANATSWGSYSYDPKEDVLRVKVKPVAGPYREWLAYDFIDRETDHATVALQWEELSVPIKVTVDDMPGLYLANIRRELRDAQGFTWVNWNDAAQYALANKRNLDEALVWAQRAIDDPFAGSANFTTLSTLTMLQMANGKSTEAAKSSDRALALASSPMQVHQYGRSLQLMGQKEQAMRVFEANAKKYPGRWPTSLGLARGYSEMGDSKRALAMARKAVAQAPDEPSRKNVERFVQSLEARPTQNATN
ncbi:MAG: DUF2911 domain-containing protein [Candidatus Eisenbacteria bacterium]